VVVSAANDGSIVGTTEGRLLASNCFQCHGTYGSGGFEQLLGESEAEIYEELVEYQDDPDFTTDIMAAHLQGYTDAQLRAIAKYLANP
jgi:cytochrome c553